ncbi:2Fe-2S ferredoxin [Pusillimonas sp. T7-7]|uniref:2Fe-2S iron-sulfur cluster-binding protein n=1 Tax=Pusillimonas sp. (strain T7-7) TaxID=1007105 RepID=UPI0002084F54|nr:2Fe-2S iron-sulfur cluster-binding protein [Pusillimonas sp. T7-7]AEC21208.1 2Fe-2S ferredoxin [Pusillimonas sp. T7-7]
MPTITYIQPDETTSTIDVDVGLSLMHGATMNDIEGIAAECGGNAMCATCHVYVESHFDQLPPISDDEDALLYSTAAERQENSRLCCQIIANDLLNGMAVRIPQVD